MHLFVHAILHEESFFSYEGPATERKATNSTKNVIESMEIQRLQHFAQSKEIQNIPYILESNPHPFLQFQRAKKPDAD